MPGCYSLQSSSATLDPKTAHQHGLLRLGGFNLLALMLCLLVYAVGCHRPDDEVTSVEIPIRLAPNRLSAADYRVRVSISAADMGTISETVPLTITRASQASQKVRLQEVPIGKNRRIVVEILQGDQVLAKKSKTVDLGKSNPTFSFKMDDNQTESSAGGQSGNKIVWSTDGAKMVRIPAGSYQMGDAKKEAQKWMAHSRPVHQVQLDAFYIDQYEVSVGQFKKFVQQSGYDFKRWAEVKKYAPSDDYPMVFVSWREAKAYADWAGKRLPTEAEWEYAARGGLKGKRYAGGDTISHDQANYTGTGGKDRWESTSPRGSFKANGLGLHDMDGNVAEWCADWYAADYYKNSSPQNPLGPATGSKRVARGGCWYSISIEDLPAVNLGNNTLMDLRLAVRHSVSPTGYNLGLGFRCVSDRKKP